MAHFVIGKCVIINKHHRFSFSDRKEKTLIEKTVGIKAFEEIETATENIAFNIPRQLRDVAAS